MNVGVILIVAMLSSESFSCWIEDLAVAGVILMAGKSSSNGGNFLQRVFNRFWRISVFELMLHSDSSSGAARCRVI